MQRENYFLFLFEGFNLILNKGVSDPLDVKCKHAGSGLSCRDASVRVNLVYSK